MKFLLFILLGFTLHGKSPEIYAWDSTAAKYMPLQVGNIWVYYYNYTAPSTGGNGYEKYKITGITEINGKYFYSFTLERRVISGPAICDSRIYSAPFQLRLDSASGNIFKTTNCGQNFEGVVDSLRAKIFDSARVCGNFQGNVSRCIDTSNITIFGQSRKSKKFYVQAFEGSNTHEYTQGIGLTYFLYGQLMSQCRLYLVGCFVNGLFLGDTTLFVGINQLNTEVPNKFELSQNYPNPFNPVTKIKFSIPLFETTRRVVSNRLIIYDALGQEAAVLVNQQLQPGTYEADWDASAYPSGVYYYKLIVETSQRVVFTETKKMVLIK